MTASMFLGHINPDRVGTCHWCKVEGPVTRDHVVPASVLRVVRSRGIPIPTIVVDACFTCNHTKSDMLPWEWHDYLASRTLPLPPRRRAFLNTLPPRPRQVQSGHCADCGGKGARHFTACTSRWAAQSAAFNGS